VGAAGEAVLVPIAILGLLRLLRDVIPPLCCDLTGQRWNAYTGATL